VIEGYRAAPWFHEMARRSAAPGGSGFGIADCKRCMNNTPRLSRQYLGCGYEPRLDETRVKLTIWNPPSSSNGKVGYSGEPLTTCAGYTANLPEVVEAAKGYAHWSKGNVPIDRNPQELLDAILIISAQYSQLQHWLMTPAKDGGGGQ